MDYGSIDVDYATHLATIPEADDGPIWMVNFMRYKKAADYGAEGGEEISGKEADDRYNPTEVLDRIGADVAFFGDVQGPEGEPDPDWDRMAIVRYPTRRSFIEMQSRPDFKEKRVHKDAGMEFSIIMCSLPTGPVLGEPDGGGIVYFIAYPAGSAGADRSKDGAHFVVEGTIIGDERRWSELVITWSDPDDQLPEGAMVVRSTSVIDQLRPLVDDSLAR